MDIDSQKVFLKLAQNLNFTETARECFMAPSTLTRLIQRMEDKVGYGLFERDNHMVRLTPTGEAFRAYAEKAIITCIIPLLKSSLPRIRGKSYCRMEGLSPQGLGTVSRPLRYPAYLLFSHGKLYHR